MEYKNPHDLNISEILKGKIENPIETSLKLVDLQKKALYYDICSMVQLFSTNSKLKNKYIYQLTPEKLPLLLEWHPSIETKKVEQEMNDFEKITFYVLKLEDLKNSDDPLLFYAI